MSDILRTIDHMRARGVAAEAILEAVYALEAARADKLEQRREADRGRQRRHRLGKRLDEQGNASRDTSAVTAGQPPEGSLSPTPPFSPKPPLSLSISGASTREERLALQRDLQQNHWQDILGACRKRANGSLDPVSSGVLHAGDIIQLIAPLEGEPCDLEADLFPAIDVQVARHHKTGKPIRSWSWIKDDAITNRNRRLAGLPPVESPDASRHERPSPAGGSGTYRGRGPTQDPLDLALARVGGRQADPDVIDHPPIGGARRAAAGV